MSVKVRTWSQSRLNHGHGSATFEVKLHGELGYSDDDFMRIDCSKCPFNGF